MYETVNAKADPPDLKSRDKNSIYNTCWRDNVSISSKLYFNSLPRNQLEDLSRQRLKGHGGEYPRQSTSDPSGIPSGILPVDC